MEVGPTTQKFRVAPDQGVREKGGADLVLRPISTREINPTMRAQNWVDFKFSTEFML
jgi:hypothetical protein